MKRGMFYLRAGDTIKILNPVTRRKMQRALIREGFEIEVEGSTIKVITDRIGLRKNY